MTVVRKEKGMKATVKYKAVFEGVIKLDNVSGLSDAKIKSGLVENLVAVDWGEGECNPFTAKSISVIDIELEDIEIESTLDVIAKWEGTAFQSSTGKTEEFSQFAHDFTRAIRREFGTYFDVEVSIGHFYLSGFLRNVETDLYAYFSMSDVRYFRDSWVNNMMIRTAEGPTDYTGGINHNVSLLSMLNKALWLTGSEEIEQISQERMI